MMVGLDSVPQRFCFECPPETFAELVERAGVIPAPYVGRCKRVMVKDPAALPDSELEDRIRQSYRLVAYKVQKQKARQKTQKKMKFKRRKSRV
jgi:predicted DNA-binding protein (MmcQ/YjbR family)